MASGINPLLLAMRQDIGRGQHHDARGALVAPMVVLSMLTLPVPSTSEAILLELCMIGVSLPIPTVMTLVLIALREVASSLNPSYLASYKTL